MSITPSIQAYAYVVVIDAEAPELVRAASNNLQEIIGRAAQTTVDRPATELFSPQTLGAAKRMVEQLDTAEIALTEREPVDWEGRQLIAHRSGDRLVLEIEHRTLRDEPFPEVVALREMNQAIIGATSSQALLQGICDRLGKFLHYDRVIAYSLGADGGGVVSQEYNNGRFPVLQGTHYRQSDFPLEAHRRYRLETVLSYPYAGSSETSFTGELGEAEETVRNCLGCRQIYDTLEQFVREQEITSFLSIALWDEDELWGMVFGHAREPVYLDHQMRTFAHLVGNLTSQALVYRAFNIAHRQLLANEYIRTRMRENLASATSLLEGLQNSDPSITDLIPHTDGAAILLDGELVVSGKTPPDTTIRDLLAWTRTQVGSRDVFSTDHLASLYATDSDIVSTAAGVLVIPLNMRCTDWIIWFRREHAQKVTFGSRQPDLRNQSRRFEPTTEIRRGYSLPWKEEHLEEARDLQSYIRDVVLERYGELTRINNRLRVAYDELESFSYTVSHDLRAPLRGIDGFAEILMEDFGPQIDADGKALIQVIQQNAARMNQFITDILELSRIGRVNLHVNECEVRKLVRVASDELSEHFDSPFDITLKEPLPPISGDARLLTMVFRHLLSNAIKYSVSRERPLIEIGYRQANEFGDGEYYVSDNGIGIDAVHHERVFGMFNRLVTQEDYAGNGVGLAIVRRILHRHNGGVRIESEVGKGATFLFYTDPNLSQIRKQLL